MNKLNDAEKEITAMRARVKTLESDVAEWVHSADRAADRADTAEREMLLALQRADFYKGRVKELQCEMEEMKFAILVRGTV